MHEFSIAEALATQVQNHAPAIGRVREVEIRVGALRGLEPAALAMCWEAVTSGSRLEGSILQVDARPWTITCPSCGRRWDAAVPFVTCSCGESNTTPSGGDELDLVALLVDEDEPSEMTA